MQSVSSGSLSSGPLSLATEPETCSSSFFCNYDRLLGRRQHKVLSFPSWSIEDLPFRVRMKSFHRRRKFFKVGVAPEVSEKKIAGKNNAKAQLMSNVATDHDGRPPLSSEQRVYNVILKQAALVDKPPKSRSLPSDLALDSIPVTTKNLLNEAYDRCGEVCAEYAKTFYLGTLLMTPERRKAIWAIYVWCRRTDELVDGPNASQITPTALNRWEQRLERAFEGQPYDMLDAALAETVLKFPVDIQPFRDMINGMRMDLFKSRYFNFDELYLYCYYVAGTVGLMSVPIMGIDPGSKASTESVYNAALALVTDKWRAFMKDQIKRARIFFKQAEMGVLELDKDSRWPVWASLLLYEQILDSIEANDYDNFTKRAYVGKWKKLITVPVAYVRAVVPPSVTRLAATG
ncbi:hypothetical protein O6H91_04G013300 [Diphasiastrum complanatum]|uniref:Uncharacterized protein n=1 Tax=Diphasiastrum complanatum TaxID=34168 RepID=A0ACC2DUI7_DIPCM|nr:hypothetical protein O6H91_04G013300 [Diphasiastrum complanatum]